MRMTRSLAVLGSIALSLSLALPAQAQTLTVDNSFQFGGTSWRGAPGRFEVAWKSVRLSDGGWAVCGAWTLSNQLLRRGARKKLTGAEVYADGERVARGLGRFNRVNHRNGLDGAEARCVGVNAPANTVSLTVDFGNGSFRD